MARQRGEREVTGQLRKGSRVSRISAATAPEGVQSGGLKSSTGQDVAEVAGQLDDAARSPGAAADTAGLGAGRLMVTGLTAGTARAFPAE